MSGVVKPMLAKDGDLSKITYPVIVQPKLDGIRCLIVDGVARSRTFKPIPNKEIQAALGRPEYNGLDGEIIVGDPTAEGCMQATTSFVMAPNKVSEEFTDGLDWTFYIFDRWDVVGPYSARWHECWTLRNSSDYLQGVSALITNFQANSAAELEKLEAECLTEGHEGIIVRDPSAPYKHGRSGVKGPLLKVKRFIDFEAEILGVYEEQENTNEATRDAFGRTERSTKKEGKVGKGCLGGFELRALNGPCAGVEFRCGTGFDREQRILLWQSGHDYGRDLIGKTVKIKSFPVGVKDAPRFPVFLGFRDMEVDG
jgi:DNA ligase 1